MLGFNSISLSCGSTIILTRLLCCCGLIYDCMQVREIVAVLDLDVVFYPCPRNGPNFRPKVLEMGGKLQFPYMVRLIPLSLN